MGKYDETISVKDNIDFIVHEFKHNFFTESKRVPFQNLSNVKYSIPFVIISVTLFQVDNTNGTKKAKSHDDPILQAVFGVTLTDRREALRTQSYKFESGNYHFITWSFPNMNMFQQNRLEYTFISFEYMRHHEAAHLIEPYLDDQNEITSEMRRITVDWFVQVTLEKKTLF